MADKKQDLRVAKTQRALVQALFTLLEKQGFSKITINDICGEAMVSRSTFYAHFEDKYQLLHFSLRELEHRVFANAGDKDLRGLLVEILENTHKNEKTLRNLMLAELDIELIEMFRQHFIEIFKTMLEKRGLGVGLPEAKVEVVASFFAAGVAQTIALWVAGKLPLSAGEMADTLLELLAGLDAGRPGAVAVRL